jgi:putative spermidine/putrescine transport system permease protein
VEGASFSKTFAALAIWAMTVVVFLLAPMALIVWASFGSADTLSIPPSDLSLRWQTNLWRDSAWRGAFLNSVHVALLAGTVSTLAAAFAATALASLSRLTSRILVLLLLLPTLFPPIALAVAQVQAFGLLGIGGGLLRLAISHLAVCLPMAYLIAALAFEGDGQRHVQLALAQSRSRLFALGRVIIPLFSAQLTGAFCVSVLLSFDEPVLSLFLGGPEVETVPRKIFASLRYELDPTAAAVTFSVFVMWLIVSLFLVLFSVIHEPRGQSST